jgi:ribonucleoside-diphosphate reductase alpha chain
LNIGKVENKKKSSSLLTPRPRPTMTKGATMKNRIGCGNLYVTVNSDENGICEVFTNTGRAGGCPSQSEATSRLISLALRSNIDISEVVEQLRGIRCLSCISKRNGKGENGDGIKALSCPDAIGRVIEHYLSSNGNRAEYTTGTSGENLQSFSGPIPIHSNPVSQLTAVQITLGHSCPDCGSALEHESGCIVCRSCGFSQCH